MFAKMLYGALTRQKGKLMMVAFTTALGVSLATAMLNVMFDVGDKVNQELKTYGANLLILPRGASMLRELYELEDGKPAENDEKYLFEEDLLKIKMIFWAFNIADFAPYLQTRVNAVGAEKITLVGTWFDKLLQIPNGDEVQTGMLRLKSWWDIEGAIRDEETNAVMAGQALAARLQLKNGDTLTVRAPDGTAYNLKIGAIFHSGGEDDQKIFAPLALAQAISGRPGQVQYAEVSALTTPENDLARRAAQDPDSLSRSEWDAWYCTAYISAIAYQIEEVMPDARVKAVLQVADSEGAILQKTQLLMLLLTFLILLCSALAISNLVTANVMERSTEIGLMKALGASNAAITILILSEIMIAALLGGMGGYGAGLLFAQIIGHSVFGAAIAVKATVIPLIIVLVAVITALGSLPAIRILLALRPTEVLHR
jgi:putative ABC transport system permease protein